MKKVLAALLLLIVAASCGSADGLGNSVTIAINGASVNFPTAQPFIDENNRTLVPTGAMDELLGTVTSWDENEQTVQLLLMKDAYNGDYVRITVGSNEIEKGKFYGLDGAVFQPEGIIEMDTAAILKNDMVFIPIRYATESLGFTVEWNESESHVSLISMQEDSFEFSILRYMPKDKNYILSPFSLKMALAMAANGAEGETKHEIMDALCITDLELFNNTVKDFIINSNSSKYPTAEFSITNSIWLNSDYYMDEAIDFAETYKDTIKDYFLGTADKINNADGARTVNNWIYTETKGIINNMITNDIVENCLSILVNTIYFKDVWQDPFMEGSTREDTFTDRSGKKKTTAFMNDSRSYDYYENDDFQMLAKPYLAKPYKNYDVKMYLILPKKDKVITKIAFENAIGRMEKVYTNLSLPRFKTESLHLNLTDILKIMGIQTAFNPNAADFLNMYSKKPPENIYINLMLQKSFIEVNEKGTEVSSATGGFGGGMGVLPRVVDFKCDRPFTYFIRNDVTGDILFVGEYAFVE